MVAHISHLNTPKVETRRLRVEATLGYIPNLCVNQAHPQTVCYNALVLDLNSSATNESIILKLGLLLLSSQCTHTVASEGTPAS